MKKWILLVLVLLVGVAVALAYLDPYRRASGILRGEAFYEGRPSSSWAQDLLSPEPGVPETTMERLQEGGTQAVPVLRDLLRHGGGSGWDREEVRWKAAEVLGKIGPDAEAALPDLMAALDDPSTYVRTVATPALAAVGKNQPAEVIAALRAHLKTDDPTAVIRALSVFKADAKDSIPDLLPLLADSRPAIRWNAIRTLGKIGPDAASTIPDLVKAMGDEDPAVREHAAEALGDIGPLSAPAVPDLIKILGDSNAKVRRDAARSLGQIGEGARPAVEPLKVLLKDEEKIVRDAAAKSIRQIDPEQKPTPP